MYYYLEQEGEKMKVYLSNHLGSKAIHPSEFSFIYAMNINMN